ncbi:hypothetical protein N9408_09295 [Opitutales bacterium]|nr:hypothetical protein [Opitutales bacterium]
MPLILPPRNGFGIPIANGIQILLHPEVHNLPYQGKKHLPLSMRPLGQDPGKAGRG